MDLSPEERRQIYEEEKAKMESEGTSESSAGKQTMGLATNVAGMLSYLGLWVTGIIFLVLEQKDRVVRFHAAQSIIVFAALSIAAALLAWIPAVGPFFGATIGIMTFIAWLILIIRTYQGEMLKLPIAGDIAEAIVPLTAAKTAKQAEADFEKKVEDKAAEVEMSMEEIGKRLERYLEQSRAAQITGYGFAIFWNVAILIFLTFFNEYIAWYATADDGSVTRLPMLTDAFNTWLPIFIVVTSLTIAAYIMLIIYNKPWFHEVTQIFISVLGIVSTATLVTIFPFDFSVIPNATAVDVVPMVVTAVLIFIAVAMGITILVRTAKLIGMSTK
jgi:uncharacterized membrane protein